MYVLTDSFFLQTKVLYVASMNDQVVPIHSGLFTAISHPLILCALTRIGELSFKSNQRHN